jgi:hypothetical protein
MEIQDYSNYLIYDDGRVFSKKSNKYLKPSNNNNAGYFKVVLCKNNNTKNFTIHRLVALHYLNKIEGKDYVDHIDGNKLNNNVNNLRWVTNMENGNNYQKMYSTNTSGFKNIYKHSKGGFEFRKNIYGKKYSKYHKNLNELLWFKFVLLINQKLL